jgi:hypothetical protein
MCRIRAVHDLPRLLRLGAAGVVVHHLRQQLLVEAAPVDADAHRLGDARGDLDHLRELPVVLLALADVAGLMRYFESVSAQAG